MIALYLSRAIARWIVRCSHTRGASEVLTSRLHEMISHGLLRLVSCTTRGCHSHSPFSPSLPRPGVSPPMFVFLVRLFASFAATASSGAQYVAYPRTVTSGRAVSNAHKQYRSPEGHRRIRWKHRLHWRVDFSSPDTSALFNTMGPSSCSSSCHDGEDRGFGSGNLGAAGKESGLFLPAWNPKNSDRGGRSCAAQSSPSQHSGDTSRTTSSWRRLPFNTQREDARVDVVLVPPPVGREPVQGQPPCGASVEDGGDGSCSHAMVSSVRWLGSDENGKETFALHIEHTDLARLGSCCSCRGDPPRRRACGVRVDRNLQKAARINKMVELSTAETDANKTLDAEKTLSFISKCVVIHFHGNGHYVEQNFSNLLKLAVATGCDVFAPEYAHYVNNVEVPAEVGREGEVVPHPGATGRTRSTTTSSYNYSIADAVKRTSDLAYRFVATYYDFSSLRRTGSTGEGGRGRLYLQGRSIGTWSVAEFAYRHLLRFERELLSGIGAASEIQISQSQAGPRTGEGDGIAGFGEHREEHHSRPSTSCAKSAAACCSCGMGGEGGTEQQELGISIEQVVVSPAARQEAAAKDAVWTGAADAVSGRAMLAAEFLEHDVERYSHSFLQPRTHSRPHGGCHPGPHYVADAANFTAPCYVGDAACWSPRALQEEHQQLRTFGEVLRRGASAPSLRPSRSSPSAAGVEAEPRAAAITVRKFGRPHGVPPSEEATTASSGATSDEVGTTSDERLQAAGASGEQENLHGTPDHGPTTSTPPFVPISGLIFENGLSCAEVVLETAYKTPAFVPRSLLTGAFATSTWLANMPASSCSPTSSWLNVGEKLASFRRKQNELTRFLAQELLDGTTQSKFGVLGRRRQLVVAETLRKLMLVEDGKMYEAATLVSSQPRFLFLHTVDDQVVGVKSLLENLSQIIGSGTNAEIEDRAELVEVIAKHQHRRKVLDESRLSQTKANKGRAPASAPSAAARSGKEPALVLGMSSRGRDHPNQVQASARQDKQATGPARAARMSWSPDLGSEQQRAALGLEEPLYRKKFPHEKTGNRIVAGDKYSGRRIAVARPVTAVLFPRGGHDQGGNLGVDAVYLAEIKEFVSAAGEDVVASGGEYML